MALAWTGEANIERSYWNPDSYALQLWSGGASGILSCTKLLPFEPQAYRIAEELRTRQDTASALRCMLVRRINDRDRYYGDSGTVSIVRGSSVWRGTFALHMSTRPTPNDTVQLSKVLASGTFEFKPPAPPQ